MWDIAERCRSLSMLSDAYDSEAYHLASLEIEKLRYALSEAADMVEYLGGKDNSCDPSPTEEIKEWRAMAGNK